MSTYRGLQANPSFFIDIIAHNGNKYEDKSPKTERLCYYIQFMHTCDTRMFLIGRQPVINTVNDQLAGHKQAAPEPLSAMYALCVSRIRVNKHAQITRSANDEHADHPS